MLKKPKKPRLPTERQTALLRRIAQSKVIVTFSSGCPTYCYDGGMLDPDDFRRFVKNGWLVGDRGDSPFDRPQVYRVRKP